MSFKDKILNNQSPWGTPPGGDGGRGAGGNGSGARQDPPSLDELIKNFQKTINKFSGGKSGVSNSLSKVCKAIFRRIKIMPIIKNNIPNAAIRSGKTIGEETVSGDEKS